MLKINFGGLFRAQNRDRKYARRKKIKIKEEPKSKGKS